MKLTKLYLGSNDEISLKKMESWALYRYAVNQLISTIDRVKGEENKYNLLDDFLNECDLDYNAKLNILKYLSDNYVSQREVFALSEVQSHSHNTNSYTRKRLARENSMLTINVIKAYIEDFKKIQIGPIPIIVNVSNEQRIELLNELRQYFENAEQLEDALNGKSISIPIIFLHEMNRLTELFRRLRYNEFIVLNKESLAKWICATFKAKKADEIVEFKKSTVIGILKPVPKGAAGRSKRICNLNWLPYKPPSELSKI